MTRCTSPRIYIYIHRKQTQYAIKLCVPQAHEMKVLSIILLFILFSRAVNVNDVGTIILRAGANWVS